jgi:hypothetical protein
MKTSAISSVPIDVIVGRSMSFLTPCIRFGSELAPLAEPFLRQLPHLAELATGAFALSPVIPVIPVIGGGLVVVAAIWLVWQVRTRSPFIETTAGGQKGSGVKDNVACGVFAPPRVAPGEKFNVQVHLHLLEDRAKVWWAALRIDQTTNLLGFKPLMGRIARGAAVDLFLESKDLIITQPTRRLHWEGTPAHEVFEVEEARTNCESKSIQAFVYVDVDDVPLGEVEFKLRVNVTAWPARGYAETRTASYKKAFVSYSSKDFDHVKIVAQGLEAAEYKVLTDVTDIPSGFEWEKKIPALIEDADLFCLVWTQNAATSPWVDKEAQYAVRLYDRSDPHRPRICPVVHAADESYPSPPKYLAKFQFSPRWAGLQRPRQVPVVGGTA